MLVCLKQLSSTSRLWFLGREKPELRYRPGVFLSLVLTFC